MINVEKAKIDPAAVFNHPRQVVENETLTRMEKIDILRRWALDARALEIADEENMAGGNGGQTLDAVLKCLNQMEAPLHNQDEPTYERAPGERREDSCTFAVPDALKNAFRKAVEAQNLNQDQVFRDFMLDYLKNHPKYFAEYQKTIKS